MGKRRKKKGKQRRSSGLSSLFWLLIVVTGAGAAGWYFLQEEPERRQVKEQASEWLETARQQSWMPREVSRLLERLQEWLPYTGPVVDPGLIEGSREYLYAGIPDSGGRLVLLQNAGYLVGYDERRRNPGWSAYRLFSPAAMEAPERPERFNVDMRTRSRVSADDYTNTGYDRGHLAPNYAIAVCFGALAQEETFLMSNIIPQKPELNREVWRLLEQEIIRKWAVRFEELWVITGPVYGSDTRTFGPGVAIPEASFKIVLDELPEGGIRVLAFRIPQEPEPTATFRDYLTSVDAIEAETGLDFYNLLPEEVQTELESQVARRVW